ncbi:hypothetical protein [Ciceribacter sp. L1K22]|uniref:hypothetical protein n=1 Tax=Ciceribacter sp. L1K22 TaxID=2820275 RepID=UPI001ABDCCB0|nr:hypothetical protein [Ciceribacter sp. L1K22]MBO3760465.1 hypothetical protein [Ciceribacter sp. L1K22]
MNPYVSLNWFEIVFPVLMAVFGGVQLWRRGPFRDELLGKIALSLVFFALIGASTANLFYQRLLSVRAWPTAGIHDQVVVTAVGDVYVKVKDPIMGRADRVQRYSCRGELKTSYQPDNAGGLFKIVAGPDNTLSIYSVRTDSIDTFDRNGRFLQRREVDSTNMPFNFLKSGPSVTKVNGCEFGVDPVSGRPAVRDRAGVWPLERGDWALEYVFNRQNIIGGILFAILLLLITFVRGSMRIAAAKA